MTISNAAKPKLRLMVPFCSLLVVDIILPVWDLLKLLIYNTQREPSSSFFGQYRIEAILSELAAAMVGEPLEDEIKVSISVEDCLTQVDLSY